MYQKQRIYKSFPVEQVIRRVISPLQTTTHNPANIYTSAAASSFLHLTLFCVTTGSRTEAPTLAMPSLESLDLKRHCSGGSRTTRRDALPTLTSNHPSVLAIRSRPSENASTTPTNQATIVAEEILPEPQPPTSGRRKKKMPRKSNAPPQTLMTLGASNFRFNTSAGLQKMEVCFTTTDEGEISLSVTPISEGMTLKAKMFLNVGANGKFMVQVKPDRSKIFPFMNLPAELRDKIYGLVIGENQRKDIDQWYREEVPLFVFLLWPKAIRQKGVGQAALNLFQVNQKIRKEAFAVTIRVAKFQCMDVGNLANFLRGIELDGRRSLTWLSVNWKDSREAWPALPREITASGSWLEEATNLLQQCNSLKYMELNDPKFREDKNLLYLRNRVGALMGMEVLDFNTFRPNIPIRDWMSEKMVLAPQPKPKEKKVQKGKKRKFDED
ncbi:hypothetical protein M501DRAFT_1027520 [Patellaria atrata CBS 101060]|uniref:Uncharacterized protein n=1 Tax=Patellaria atrata CBS 101060 TaxID=1346257 RepID=A0A9P4VWD1_9PEZI|nr:hypothetical protein M501DRAFT_1027520 [Patellaria atrata CBS 101060]